MRRFLLSAMVLVFLTSNICYAQSAKEAVTVLQQLRSKCQAGISYPAYGPAVGDAKFEVDLFLEGKEAKEKPEIAESVHKAMDFYEEAKRLAMLTFGYEIWGGERGFIRIGAEPRESDTNERLSIESARQWNRVNERINSMVSPVLKRHPEIKVEVKGANYKLVYVPDLVNAVWNDASKELDKAMKLLSQ